MSRGWYARRRGILEHLERGTLSLLDSAIHDFLCLIADHKTGVCWASAEKINALCPAEFSYKSIQRSLAKLERLGMLKRWMIRGRRGNYPVLVCRYFVRDASMTWWSTNGERTTDWRDVQFDPVHDPSFNGPPSVRSGVREPDHDVFVSQGGDVSGDQEVRTEKSKSKTHDDDEFSLRDDKARRVARSPALSGWARGRILQRAGAVKSRHAYLRSALPEFFKNLPREIEEFLTERAETFLSDRLREKPHELVLWHEIYGFLQDEANKHRLPVDQDMFERATRGANLVLGLVEKPLSPAR
jgi:hypothetical protein